MIRSVTVRTSPSLALTKYWGKLDLPGNIPATASLAVTLNSLYTESRIEPGGRDAVIVDGTEQNPDRFAPFFNAVRQTFDTDLRFRCESRNNFPTASGLASSSSGFAALAVGINYLMGETLSLRKVSALARGGSASAARAVYGGFTCLPAGGVNAESLYPSDFWPDLRVIVVSVSRGMKSCSSRRAMERSRQTSPFYDSWVKDSQDLNSEALAALEKKDLARLGPLVRMSYLRMFSTMLSADPPLIYWLPGSLDLIHFCSRMREQGLGAWETMDAGPQVKIFCLKEEAHRIAESLRREFPQFPVMVDSAGPGPVILEPQ